MYSLDKKELLKFFSKQIILGHPSFLHLDLVKFPSFTYFMIWVSDFIALPKNQMSFSMTSVLIAPALREVLFWFVLLCSTQKCLTLRVTTVFGSLKDLNKETNRNQQQKSSTLFFLLQVMFIATRWWFTQGKSFCDPNWSPGTFYLWKHFRTVMWLCKTRMNYSF